MRRNNVVWLSELMDYVICPERHRFKKNENDYPAAIRPLGRVAAAACLAGSLALAFFGILQITKALAWILK